MAGPQLKDHPLGSYKKAVRANLTLLLATSVLLFGLCASPIAYHSWWEKQHLAAFARLSEGTSQQELEALAGAPVYVTDGTRWVEPEFEKSKSQIVPGCVAELWYHSRVPFIPSRFAYCFSSDGRLVHKYHWASW